MSEPTYYKPLQPVLTPPPLVEDRPTEYSTPQASFAPRYHTPVTPLTPLPSSLTPSGPLPTRRRRSLLIALITLVVLVLVGSGSGAFFLLNQPAHVPIAPAEEMVGQAFFVSSGQLSENGDSGLNDELQINLRNIANPAPGTIYYAWLLRDTNHPDELPLPLGQLSIKQGLVHFLYKGDAQHLNLLAFTSRLLITQEDASMVPVNPSPDFRTWRYIAEIPQKPDPNDTSHHFSMLDHLRFLLADDPILISGGMRGGLNIWLQRNTGKILEWAGSARDYWPKSLDLMHFQLLRILDYLDGEENVQADVPPDTPLLARTPLALIGTETPAMQNTLSSDYLHEISGQLNTIALAPGVTPDQRMLTGQINIAMNYVRDWLEHVRADAKKLLALSEAQLLSQASLAILDDMVTDAFSAYAGRIDPSTSQVQSGVTQIGYSIEHLATLEVEQYRS